MTQGVAEGAVNYSNWPFGKESTMPDYHSSLSLCFSLALSEINISFTLVINKFVK